MPTKNKIPKDYLEREFVITREFAARRDLVFKAWTDAKLLAQWWGPRGFTNPVCHWDARAGQAIHVVMRAPNGVDYPMGGEFREVVAPERLVFTSGALNGKGKMLFEFLHTATFVERNGQTLLTLQSRVIKTTAEANKYIGGFEAGMTQSLERLKGLIAKSQIGKRPSRELSLTRIFDAPRELARAPREVVRAARVYDSAGGGRPARGRGVAPANAPARRGGVGRERGLSRGGQKRIAGLHPCVGRGRRSAGPRDGGDSPLRRLREKDPDDFPPGILCLDGVARPPPGRLDAVL